MEPDVIIEVRFKTTAEGGRLTAIGGTAVVDYYACPFVIEGEAFDCRLLLGKRRLELGETYEVPVKFMSWQLVHPKLRAGASFALWEGKDVATGKVLRLQSK